MAHPDGLDRLVEAAIKAPSSHNTQPWLFELGASEITLIADRTRALPVNDPNDRELTVSCGAALFNLRVAAAASGKATAVDLLPEGKGSDVLARIRIEEGVPGDEASFAAAIDKRRTFRKPFAEREPDEALFSRLVEAVDREGAWLHMTTDSEERIALAELIAEGDRIQFSDPSWRRELAAWMHPRRRSDGLTSFGFATPLVRLVVSAFDLGESTAGKDEGLAEEAPALAVMGTSEDSPEDWLRAGQALQRMLLTAAGEGVQAAYLNQPCQVAELRPKLQNLLDRPGWPQVVMRLGYPSEDGEQTPRRPLEAVLSG
jgi:nitroreductase